MAEVVVLEIDVSSLAKGLADSQTQLEIYKRGMEQAIEANGRFSEAANLAAAQVQAQAKEVKQTEGALLRLTQAEKALGGSLQELIKTYDATTKSNDENKKVLNALRAEYNKLTGAARENLAPALKKISDELKKQEGVAGDTRRNVGNYFNEFAKGIPVLGQTVSGIQNMGLAFKSAGGGVQGFSAALATTGLPLFIAGVNLLIDAFKSFKPVADQVERVTAAIGASFNALVTGRSMSEAAEQAYELTAQLQDLEDAQGALIISNSIFDSKIKQLLVSLRNKNLTEQEGIKVVEELRRVEQERFQQNSELAKEELRIAREEFLNKTGLYSAELDALLERGRVKRELDEEEIENLMRSGDLTRQQVLDLVASERTRQDALAKGAEERAKISDDEIKKIIELTARVNQIKGESAVLNEQISNRESAFNERFLALKEKELEAQKKLNEEKRKAQEAEDALNLKNEQQIIVEQSRLSQLAIDNAQKEADEIVRIKEEGYKKQLQLQNETSAEFLKNEEQTFQQKKVIQQAEVSFARTVSSSLISFISNIAEASGASAAFNKTLALVEIATQTAIALVTGIASSQDLPYPGNLIAMGTTIASVLASIGQAVNIINNSPNPAKPSFASGVIGLDGPGTETSDSIDAKLSKGESVLTAKATRKYHRQLAYMEMSVGNSPNYQFGKGRFAGGFIPTISDGGFTARETVRQSDSMAFMSAAIREGFANAPAPKLSIVELENKQASRNRSISISEA